VKALEAGAWKLGAELVAWEPQAHREKHGLQLSHPIRHPHLHPLLGLLLRLEGEREMESVTGELKGSGRVLRPRR
jgi:hypothetical protein